MHRQAKVYSRRYARYGKMAEHNLNAGLAFVLEKGQAGD